MEQRYLRGDPRSQQKNLIKNLARDKGILVDGKSPEELICCLIDSGSDISKLRELSLSSKKHMTAYRSVFRNVSKMRTGKYIAKHFRHAPIDFFKGPSKKEIEEFYASWEWKECSYLVRKSQNNTCQCCGASPKNGIRVVCDHIKPLRSYWSKRLDMDNMQTLCDDCNRGKGSHDETDWRIK